MNEERINATLKRLIPPETEPLFEMAHYSLEGGKRLRPQLTLATLEGYGLPIEHGLVPACVIEMIHTYSLIHDDLPCMDDDDMRRGKQALHKAYPESHAVLTGDFLLTRAFEALATAPHLKEETKIKLISLLSIRAGSEGMIGGQLLDIDNQGAPIEPDLFETIQLKKTGALIACSLEFGGIIAEKNPSNLKEIGMTLGLAFQLVDDMLDDDGAVLIYGKEKTQALADQLYAKALKQLNSLQINSSLLRQLAHNMVYREA